MDITIRRPDDWHPHLHALVADGLFLESGYFFVMPRVDLRPLRELFRAYVLKMLKKVGLVDDAFIKMLMSWRHVSGFNVHNEVRINHDDEKGMENLSQYIIRNTFALEKLRYNDETSSVIYRSKMSSRLTSAVLEVLAGGQLNNR